MLLGRRTAMLISAGRVAHGPRDASQACLNRLCEGGFQFRWCERWGKESGVSFESEFMPRLGRRKHGFKILFSYLRRRAARREQLVLVETGCLRLRAGRLPWEGCGCSSILFD